MQDTIKKKCALKLHHSNWRYVEFLQERQLEIRGSTYMCYYIFVGYETYLRDLRLLVLTAIGSLCSRCV